MKLIGEIIEVSTNGDSVCVVLQAKIGRASWKPIYKQTVVIDDNSTNRRAFHIGRKVTLEITPSAATGGR
jgi:hypothetical protein